MPIMNVTMKVGDTVLIKRDDRGGDRIPMEDRMYIAEKTYIYKARIVRIYQNKRYNLVQPLPFSADTTLTQSYTRKGYKTKTYTLPLP